MSRYQELAAVTEKLIADGLLRPGDRLPSIRRACLTHAISPITVSSAYQLLESRGLIDARPKSGYFVRARLGQNLSEPAMSQPGSGSTGLAVSDFIFRTLDSIKDSSVVSAIGLLDLTRSGWMIVQSVPNGLLVFAIVGIG